MIERYAKMRGDRLFRACGGESLMLHDSARGHFPVYLSARGSSPDVVTIRAHWSRCARTERVRLNEYVNRFNARNALLTATICESHGTSGLEVIAKSRFWVRDEDDFRPFVRFADRALASAGQLFEAIYAELGSYSAAA